MLKGKQEGNVTSCSDFVLLTAVSFRAEIFFMAAGEIGTLNEFFANNFIVFKELGIKAKYEVHREQNLRKLKF